MQPPPSSGGGGGSASLAQAAISNFINDQSAAQKKMIDNFGKLQEVQAMEASQNAARITQAMNQIVAREDERLSREEARKEKLEDREYQEKYHKWATELQQQAAKDFGVTQSRIASQMAAGRDFITRMDQNRTEFGDRIRGMRMKLHDPDALEYWVNTPGGMDRLQKMNRALRAAEYFHEQDHQSDYTSQVAQEMGKVQEQILKGEPHVDLTGLYGAKPQNLMADVAGPPQTTDDWTDEEVEELYDSGGYPPGGVFGRDPDDPAIQKYKNFNPIDYHTMMLLLEDEQFFAMAHHKKFQDEWRAMRAESFKQKNEARKKIQGYKTKDFDRMAETAAESVYYGVSGFVDELGSGKLNPQSLSQSLVLKSGEMGVRDYGDAMASKLLESVLLSLGGPGSEDKLKTLDNLAKGEGDGGVLDTSIELYKGFHLRNMLRHVDDQLMKMTVAPKDGKLTSFQLAKQIYDMPNTPEKGALIASLVADPSGKWKVKQSRLTGSLSPEVLGQIHRGIERLFHVAKQRAGQYRDILEAQPALQTYQMEGGHIIRYVDAIVASQMSSEGEPPSLAQARRQQQQEFEEAGDMGGEPPSEFDIEEETLKQAIGLSPLQAGAQLWADFAHHPEFLPALFSGEYENVPVVTDPVTEQDLLDNMEMSKRNRERIKAEMRRRREEYNKKHPQPGEETGQKQQLAGPPPGPEERQIEPSPAWPRG
jgi:hypothetical protein